MVASRFTWADYLIFVVCLLLSVGISIYHGIQGRKETNTSNFLMGGRDMAVLPVATSIVVSLVSAIFVLGMPVETYNFGFYYITWFPGLFLAAVVACLFYLPVFHRLQLTSVYEYLGRRFNNKVRTICSVMAMIQMLLYASVVAYAPSVAVSQATGLPYWGGILFLTAICTFYTSLGGFKTVIWTDTVQSLVILLGLIATFSKGTVDVGGLDKVLNISSVGQRTSIKNVAPDFTKRMDAWTWLFGVFPAMLVEFGVKQPSVQRFCSIRNVNKARLAVVFTFPMYVLLTLLTIGSGLIAFAYYYGCDPFQSGKIKTRDQIVPLLVMDVFRDTPGMPGLFISSIISAALSTLSSVQNSFAAVILEDVVKPLKMRRTGVKFSERAATLISKLIVIAFGITTACLAMLAATSGKHVLNLSHVASALGAAPVAGVFTLGLFFPFVNTKGAISGLCCGIFILAWATIGALSVPKILQPMLPASTTFCPDNDFGNGSTPHNFTEDTMKNISLTSTSGLMTFYSISPKYYKLVGIAPVIVVGIIISVLTGGLQDRKRVDDDVVFSFRKHGIGCCQKSERSNESSNNTRVDLELDGNAVNGNLLG